MAKKVIDIGCLRAMTKRGRQRAESRRLTQLNNESEEIRRKAKKRADDIIADLPGRIKKKARKGENELLILDSKRIRDSLMFDTIIGFIVDFCFDNDLYCAIRSRKERDSDNRYLIYEHFLIYWCEDDERFSSCS